MDTAGSTDYHPPQLDTHPRQWTVRRKDIAAAIKHAKRRSAPGPDGIPYIIWQLLGDVAIDIL